MMKINTPPQSPFIKGGITFVPPFLKGGRDGLSAPQNLPKLFLIRKVGQVGEDLPVFFYRLKMKLNSQPLSFEKGGMVNR
jgi:hypothetical protein